VFATVTEPAAREGVIMRVVRGLLLTAAVCTGLAACSNGSGASSRFVPAADREVSFVVDGTTTYGTLDVPKHRAGQRLAAALLLAGSGATDRNGDQLSAGVRPHTLQLIAEALDKMGVISLRFDKYFSGRTGGGAYAADPEKITLDPFIKQADAGYNLLRQEPETNAGETLVVGHSEGGMYALLVAESVPSRPAGLALIEPQDDRALSLLQLQIGEQLDAAVGKATITAATEQQNISAVQQAISDFRAGRPVDTSGMLPGIANLLNPLLVGTTAAYMRSADAIYPPRLAAKLPRGTRVLVTDGTADSNVPPSTIGPLAQALTTAGTSGPGLRMLSGLDHYLHPSGSPQDDQPLAPAALSAIQDWAKPYASAQV
jgi:uncharacterized protein